MAESNKERRNRIKQELLTRRGGKCVACGYSKTPSALGFHHRNPEEKQFDVSGTNLTSVTFLKLGVHCAIMLFCNIGKLST